jgi:transposase
VVYTDEWRPYDRLEGMGYQHSRVNHSQKVYVAGDVHTNTIEGFWSLQSYLDEYAFRYNHREAGGRGMFDAFLSRVQKTMPEAAS